jgi:nucleotide-binding universal stress UspA family protein
MSLVAKEKIMFREVIAGVDGKPNGRDAVALAGKLVGEGGRLTLVHVHGAEGGHHSPDSDAQARQRSLELLAGELRATETIAEIAMIGAASVGQGLHQMAEQRSADLLVVGSCSHRAVARALGVDDMRDSLEGAPCAVAVASRGYGEHPTPIARIGVAYDGSPESEEAIKLARSIAAQLRSTISALTVVHTSAYYYGGLAAVDWGEAIDRMMGEARERLAGLEDVHGRVVRGIGHEELVRFSEDVDLLISGSRGYGALRRALLGSTSEHLAHATHCPLLVLRRGLTGDAQAPAASDAPVATGA